MHLVLLLIIKLTSPLKIYGIEFVAKSTIIKIRTGMLINILKC